MFSYTRNAVQGVGANAQSNGYGLGAYVSTFFDNGLYVDSILRYIYKEHSIDASFIPSGAGGECITC
ncbi:autotransporter outer membrane beta-barrel domain-containing protein [uncultured Helicobacter sp.]|uniref:autotransporter outer membrane beta-barrel domain-containing protein n=1 Tax=uncultured Helicobacter sp. TaxID=175537 RepID=UPI001C3B4819|nr:autotransporter outer membrane beta-barrel domain-containing protein [Candidatus Helicobacter avicola]